MELDEKIIQLNKRFQDTYWSSDFQRAEAIKRYRYNIAHGKIIELIRDLKYRHYSKCHFSTDGNTCTTINGRNDTKALKIVVYSCVVGKYDSVLEPIVVDEDVDYVMFTDQHIDDSSLWKKIDITEFNEYKEKSALWLNRKIKMLPFEFLPKYDYSIYIDGNIELVASVKPLVENMGNAALAVHYHSNRDCIYDEAVAIRHFKRADMNEVNNQLKTYLSKGFPKHFGLYENSILIRKHDDEELRKIMREWWFEYNLFPTRDQLSLPYVIWKNKYKDKVFVLGNNIVRNPRFNRMAKHNFS